MSNILFTISFHYKIESCYLQNCLPSFDRPETSLRRPVPQLNGFSTARNNCQVIGTETNGPDLVAVALARNAPQADGFATFARRGNGVQLDRVVGQRNHNTKFSAVAQHEMERFQFVFQPDGRQTFYFVPQAEFEVLGEYLGFVGFHVFLFSAKNGWASFEIDF